MPVSFLLAPSLASHRERALRASIHSFRGGQREDAADRCPSHSRVIDHRGSQQVCVVQGGRGGPADSRGSLWAGLQSVPTYLCEHAWMLAGALNTYVLTLGAGRLATHTSPLTGSQGREEVKTVLRPAVANLQGPDGSCSNSPPGIPPAFPILEKRGIPPNPADRVSLASAGTISKPEPSWFSMEPREHGEFLQRF